MNKLYNTVVAILFMVFCCMVCISHTANTFFQKDIGNIVLNEVNLDEQIDMIFREFKNYVPNENATTLLNLEDELKNSENVKRVIGSTSQTMLSDIVNDGEYQEIDATLKEIVHSYDNEIKKVLGNDVSSTEIDSYIDDAIKNVPIQQTYNTVVDSFRTSIPEPYMKIMKIIQILSKQSTMLISIILALISLIALIAMNLKQMKWWFPIGMGLCSSGVLLTLAGKIIPTVYEGMLTRISIAAAQAQNYDFKLISYYGMGFLIAGIVCLIMHGLMNKFMNGNKSNVPI